MYVLITGIALFCGGCAVKIPFIGSDKKEDLPGKGNETFYFETEDGWRLAIDHYLPETKKISNPMVQENGKRTPVILCHGLGLNSYFWDITPKLSFARYLASNGYDVWVVSLRGSGTSTKNGFSVLRNIAYMRQGEINGASFSPFKFDWNIDHYIRFDIPAAINFVKEKTGAKKVTWVGHSLGGMIMYAYASLYDVQDVQGMVTIGSPIIVPQPPNNILQAFINNKVLFKSFLIINTRTGATSMANFHNFIITPDEILMYNLENVEDCIVKKTLKYVVEDIPVGVTDQVLSMIRNRDFMSYDGSINYAEKIERISMPVMLCCGVGDNIAPPESIRIVYHNISSADKTFKMFGTANGHVHNYGHNDLVLGKNARKEVYPEILDWLNKHTRLSE